MTRHYNILSFIHSFIHLSLGNVEQTGHFGSFDRRQIFLLFKLSFELEYLTPGKRRSGLLPSRVIVARRCRRCRTELLRNDLYHHHRRCHHLHHRFICSSKTKNQAHPNTLSGSATGRSQSLPPETGIGCHQNWRRRRARSKLSRDASKLFFI